MSRQIVHDERVAWDGARAFAAAIDSDAVYPWLADRLGGLLGMEYQMALADSRGRLRHSTRTDARFVETGVWRAKLENLLRDQPEMVVALLALVRDTSAVVFEDQWAPRLA